MSETIKSCCGKNKETEDHGHTHTNPKRDKLYIFSILAIVLPSIAAVLFPHGPAWIGQFSGAVIEILLTMWWGVALGIIIMGLMSKIPREYFTGLLGRSGSFSGLLRAAFSGVILDLCSHGILMVAAKLYERGVSLPQVMTFLVASPWNSISITLILIALVGPFWAVSYILGSVVIALCTGLVFQSLTRRKILPDNPNRLDIPPGYNLRRETADLLRGIRISRRGFLGVLSTGWRDGQMIIKWILFGTVLAAAMRTFVPPEIFQGWFGPTLFGLLMTVLIATVIEICSEGSAPMAGEFVHGAGAPGNGFAFLMAGVATDYTEVLVIREFTKSWKIALCLPLVTVPQVVLLAWIMNMAAG